MTVRAKSDAQTQNCRKKALATGGFPYKVAVAAYGTRYDMHSVGVHASAREAPANWTHRTDAAPQTPVPPRAAPRSHFGSHDADIASPEDSRVSAAAVHNATTRSGRTVKKRTAVQLSAEPDRAISVRSREGKMLKLALARSIVETKLAPTTEVPLARVFYPTKEQFAEPIKYIAR